MKHGVQKTPNLEIYLGRRGAGKSTLAAQDDQRAAAEDILVVAFDPLGGYPPDVGLHVVGMSGLRACAASGDICVVRGASFGEVVTWLRAISPKMRNGTRLTIDEGVILTTEDAAESLKRQMRSIIATARHHKMRVALVAQGSMLVDHSLISMADRVACFGLVGGYERTKMEMSGIPREIVDKLPTLPDHEYYRGVPGRPASEWNHYVTIAPK